MSLTIPIIREVATPISDTRLRRTVTEVLKRYDTSHDAWATVRITDDVRMRPLTRRFLGKNIPTDVLSFPVHHFHQGKPPANLPPGPIHLGEVVVNVDAAHRQAKAAGHDSIREVQFLVAHGVRHLIGFHHS
jgi:probable rRNA maturation factor